MTKADVINSITQKTGLDRTEVSSTIESFLSVVKDSMAEGNDIFIRGFGSFINKKKAKKTARNISKNTAIIIAEHYAPKFKPSPEFVDKVKNSEKVKAAKKVA